MINIKVGNIGFTQCTYFYYKDDITSNGLAFSYSGHAFGGYRNETRYPYQPPELGKPNAPEDCSSFVGNQHSALIKCQPPFFGNVGNINWGLS